MTPKPPRRNEDLTPDTANTRRDSETMERELIFGMAKSYHFYLEAREIVCPFDKVKRVHRRDFTVDRYNDLYRAIDAFYRRFDNAPAPTSDFYIPPNHLAAYIIDWGNKAAIPDDTATRLSEEILQEVQFFDEIQPAYCSALLQSPAFRDWISERVLTHVVDRLIGQRRLGILNQENFGKVLSDAQQACLLVDVAHSTALTLGEISAAGPDDPDVLLGPRRALCRKGVWLMVGTTGLGKSSLALQFMVCFAIGKPCFGIRPARAFKVLMFQAENDDGDIAEMREGIMRGLELGDEERRQACENIRVRRITDLSGGQFVSGVMQPMMAKYHPDLVVIDPALAYVGGDVREQEEVGRFLRGQLLPLIDRFNCGCLVVHHTNKPSVVRDKDRGFRSVSDMAYLGSGSAEFANLPRFILTLQPTNAEGIFELCAPKRGKRLGWKDENGRITVRKFIRQSADPETICWFECNETEFRAAVNQAEKSESELKSAVLELIPEAGIEKNELLKQTMKAGIGNKKANASIKLLLEEDLIEKDEVPRSWARPAIQYRRKQAPGVRNNGLRHGPLLPPGSNREEITDYSG